MSDLNPAEEAVRTLADYRRGGAVGSNDLAASLEALLWFMAAGDLEVRELLDENMPQGHRSEDQQTKTCAECEAKDGKHLATCYHFECSEADQEAHGCGPASEAISEEQKLADMLGTQLPRMGKVVVGGQYYRVDLNRPEMVKQAKDVLYEDLLAASRGRTLYEWLDTVETPGVSPNDIPCFLTPERLAAARINLKLAYTNDTHHLFNDPQAIQALINHARDQFNLDDEAVDALHDYVEDLKEGAS